MMVMNTETSKNSDGQYVVIKDGKRIAGPFLTLAEAQAAAAEINRVFESAPTQGAAQNSIAEVKQNIFG
jgi:hypothetical protein